MSADKAWKLYRNRQDHSVTMSATLAGDHYRVRPRERPDLSEYPIPKDLFEEIYEETEVPNDGR